jgi:hypothetical protein
MQLPAEAAEHYRLPCSSHLGGAPVILEVLKWARANRLPVRTAILLLGCTPLPALRMCLRGPGGSQGTPSDPRRIEGMGGPRAPRRPPHIL